MIVISKTILTNFGQKHADVSAALNNWHDYVTQADWKDFNALKKDFPSADYVGDNRFVFNIKGNHYRLVVLVFFSVRTVYIKFIGSHAE